MQGMMKQYDLQKTMFYKEKRKPSFTLERANTCLLTGIYLRSYSINDYTFIRRIRRNTNGIKIILK